MAALPLVIEEMYQFFRLMFPWFAEQGILGELPVQNILAIPPGSYLTMCKDD